jgi:hypothetical protein
MLAYFFPIIKAILFDELEKMKLLFESPHLFAIEYRKVDA